jgi:2',3'-cyclic-nucleotide 2'-phosphodiesterase (5'-nucleotidase family)
MRAGTRADVALINSGTMRIDDVIRAGPITNYQLESIFLFADETHVLTFPIAGARLRELLEHSVASAGHGGFAQVSGLSFTWDSTRAAGSRIVGPLRRDDGRAIAPGDTLTLAMNWYPACEHGDAYVVHEAAGACPGASRAPRVVDLLMAHLEHDLRGIIVAPTPGRIVRR